MALKHIRCGGRDMRIIVLILRLKLACKKCGERAICCKILVSNIVAADTGK